MDEITYEEFVDRMHAKVRPRIGKVARRLRATHVVLFEARKEDLDPTIGIAGAKTVICVGPECETKTVDDCRGRHLYDLLAQRQHPVAYAEVR